MQAWLKVVHQRANLQQVRLLPLTLVGRSPECHLKIASAQVSRRHCQLAIRADGVYVEDLQSANGTILDGVKLPPRTPTYVQSGSQLDVGPARFVVEYRLSSPSGILQVGDPDSVPEIEEHAESEGDSSEFEPPFLEELEDTVPPSGSDVDVAPPSMPRNGTAGLSGKLPGKKAGEHPNDKSIAPTDKDKKSFFGRWFGKSGGAKPPESLQLMVEEQPPINGQPHSPAVFEELTIAAPSVDEDNPEIRE